MQWRRNARRLALIVVLAAAGPGAQGGDGDPGRAIFTGQQGALADAAADRRLSLLPCFSCHGRDGLGGDEGRAPPIHAPALLQAGADRPAYDTAAFARAVRDGIAPSGRRLSRLMPRVALSDAEAQALFAYLSVLPVEQRRGVTPTELRLGIPAEIDRALGPAWREMLAAEVEAGLGGPVYGRQVSFVTVDAASSEPAEVLAVLAAPVDSLPDWLGQGVPVLFPFGLLEGTEDPTLVRSFLPSLRDIRQAIAARMARSARGPVTLWPAGDAKMDAALSRAGIDPVPPGREVAELLVMDGDIAAALSVTEPARIWIPASRIRNESHVPAGLPVMLALDMPALMPTADALPPAMLHARLSGDLLAEILKETGRDVTRAGLLRAFEKAWLGGYSLDYAAVPLTGTRAIEFQELLVGQP